MLRQRILQVICRFCRGAPHLFLCRMRAWMLSSVLNPLSIWTGRYTQGASRVLCVDGLLIMSAPNKPVFGLHGADQFHVRELEQEAFVSLLHREFASVERYPFWISFIW